MAKLNKAGTAAPAEKITAGDIRPGGNAQGFLLSFVERIERLNEEAAGICDDRKEVFGEAKSMGFDTKIIRKVIMRRKLDPADRMEGDSILETYEEALAAAEKAQVAQAIKDGV